MFEFVPAYTALLLQAFFYLYYYLAQIAMTQLTSCLAMTGSQSQDLGGFEILSWLIMITKVIRNLFHRVPHHTPQTDEQA
jgi:hypothetical protein